MSGVLVASDRFPFADGNAGHLVDLGAAPAAGDIDVILVGSVTVISGVAGGWTLDRSHLDQDAVQGLHRVCTGAEGTGFTVTTTGDFNTQVLWQRWRGLLAYDVSALAFANAVTSSPPAATGALAGPGELAVGMAFCSQTFAGNQVVSSWADGFTADRSGAQGAASLGTFAASAYRAGVPATGAAPSVSWTGDAATVATTVAWAFTVAPTAAGTEDVPQHRRRRR